MICKYKKIELKLEWVLDLDISYMRYNRKSIFETFFENRSSLILQYNNGDITKRELIEGNYEIVRRMNTNPFIKVDSYEKGMYNYQYYNVMAKYCTSLAKEIRDTNRHNRTNKINKQYVYYLNKGNQYYHEKDKSALSVLKVIDFQSVEAYYVKCTSKFLKDKLFEIVLLDYKEAIFHSKAEWFLDILKEEGVFIEGMKPSVIDSYINETY